MNEIEEPIVFDLSKIDLGLSEKAKAIMDKYANNIIVIEDHFDDYEDWVNSLFVDMTHGFEHKEFRTCPVFYKFYNNKNEEVKRLPFRVFIFNVIMWYPQTQFDEDNLRDELILPESVMGKIVPSAIKEYIDTFYTVTYRNKCDNHRMNEILADTIHMLAMLVHTFYKFMGLSISVEAFMDLAKRYPEFAKLLRHRLDETKQPVDIEKEAKEVAKMQWNTIINDNKFNILKPLLITNSHKEKQLAEFDSVIGLKPNVEGETISTPINKSWITGELNQLQESFINAIAGRKAAIINNEFMGSAGHMLILVAIMCADAKLSTKIDDCHSPNPIPMQVKSAKHLNKLSNRYYRFGGESEYRLLDGKKDTHLIGETIWLRSPITCCCEDGRICKKCYGDLAYVNKDLYSIGSFAAFAVMMKVMQDLLSAKHMQETSSAKIEFPPEFDQFLQLSATDVIIGTDNDDIEFYTLVISRDDIHLTDDDSVIAFNGGRRKKRVVEEEEEENTKSSSSDDDDDEDGDSSSTFKLDYYATKFYIVKNFYNKKEMEVIELEELSKKKLFMHIDFLNKMKYNSNSDRFGECFSINLEDINYDEFIFMIDVENNELSKPLKQIQSLIENKNHEGCRTYEEMAQKMLDLIIEAKNPGTSVQGEIIVRQLIRDANTMLHRPDFSRIIMRKGYEIMTVNTALRKHPSITTSMSTPYLRYQLVSQMETFEKTETSDKDAAFREVLTELAYPVIKEY